MKAVPVDMFKHDPCNCREHKAKEPKMTKTKVRISYEYDPNTSPRYWAIGAGHASGADSFEAARDKLILLLMATHSVKVPPPEEVEI